MWRGPRAFARGRSGRGRRVPVRRSRRGECACRGNDINVAGIYCIGVCRRDLPDCA
jgi:hypothetical protein